jgi:hypothetical protein
MTIKSLWVAEAAIRNPEYHTSWFFCRESPLLPPSIPQKELSIPSASEGSPEVTTDFCPKTFI